MCGPSCTGAVDDPFELWEHPGYGLRSPGKNPESVEAEEETSEDSLKMSFKFLGPEWPARPFKIKSHYIT
jgi:hypothetical protein